jgi:hypothetical protein
MPSVTRVSRPVQTAAVTAAVVSDTVLRSVCVASASAWATVTTAWGPLSRGARRDPHRAELARRPAW